ncbi:MAG TPA: hypothetical protein VF469_14110 [Kofleriaceae bacterium]
MGGTGHVDCINAADMRAALFVVIILMAACAETDEPVEADDPVELLTAIAQAYCAHLEDCSVVAPDFIYSGCTQTQWSEQSAASLREDIERGFAVWSRESSERCLQAIADDTCPIEPRLDHSGSLGALAIDLDLDDTRACRDVLVYRNPGPSSIH